MTTDQFTNDNLYAQLCPLMLEENPAEVLSILTYCNHNDIDVKARLNEEVYESWYSNMALSLCYLVGDRAPYGDPHHPSLDSINQHEHPWYGCHVLEFDQDLGINIFDELIHAGCNIFASNYYGDNITECFGTEIISTRLNNERFRDHVIASYNSIE